MPFAAERISFSVTQNVRSTCAASSYEPRGSTAVPPALMTSTALAAVADGRRDVGERGRRLLYVERRRDLDGRRVRRFRTDALGRMRPHQG